MVNKTYAAIAAIAIIVIVAAFALTQTNPNTTVSGNNGNVSNSSNELQATVIIENGTFNPSNLTVKAGTTVTWINKDPDTHMIRSSEELFMSEDLTSGQSYNYTFNKSGTYPYHDHLNMDNKNLTGIIIVQ